VPKEGQGKSLGQLFQKKGNTKSSSGNPEAQHKGPGNKKS